MPKILIPREEVFTGTHPEYLHGCKKVDHWVVDSIQQGVGAWAGDPRLALYASVKTDQWLLYRCEHDGQYRRVGASPRGERLGVDTLNKILGHLVDHDVRNGYDPVAEMDVAEAQHEQQVDWSFHDFIENEFADRLHHALRKDGMHRHVVGDGL